MRFIDKNLVQKNLIYKKRKNIKYIKDTGISQ